MKEKIYDARTGMEYVLVGDYYLPALKLPRTRPICSAAIGQVERFTMF